MSRISSILEARAQLAAAQTNFVAAQADIAAKEAVLLALAQIPLDTWTSDADGLVDFIGEDGTILSSCIVYVTGWPGAVVYGQPLIGPVSSASFPQVGSQGLGQMIADAQGRRQFQTGGSEILPVPVTLLIVKSNVTASHIDAPPTVSTITLNWL